MNNKINSNRYEHILDCEYPYPTHRKKMSMINRGAQFAPFAALTGYDSAIVEASRLTEHKIELTDDQINKINEKLNILKSLLPDVQATITHFVKDDKKDGGKYTTDIYTIKKIDGFEQKLIMNDKSFIFVEDIIDITGIIFNDYESL